MRMSRAQRDLSGEQTLRAELVAANRLYRQTAAQTGDGGTAMCWTSSNASCSRLPIRQRTPRRTISSAARADRVSRPVVQSSRRAFRIARARTPDFASREHIMKRTTACVIAALTLGALGVGAAEAQPDRPGANGWGPPGVALRGLEAIGIAPFAGEVIGWTPDWQPDRDAAQREREEARRARDAAQRDRRGSPL